MNDPSQISEAWQIGKGLLLVLGIEPGAQNDGPDVHKVLSKKGKTGHQAYRHDGVAIVRVTGILDDADRDDGDDAGVKKRCTRSRDADVVCNEQVLHGDDLIKAHGNIGWVVQHKTQDHQAHGVYDSCRKKLLVAAVFIHVDMGIWQSFTTSSVKIPRICIFTLSL